MNKDVIYIEPEDDITDIITKIENSKEKIIALVPPKKAGVFRSIVNIKLIAKAGAGAEKTVVLVTTDPSIVKLAAAAKLPVTKNLQSAPVIPVAEAAEETVIREEVVEKGDEVVATEEVVEEKPAPVAENAAEATAEETDEKNAEESASEKKAKRKEKTPKTTSKNLVVAWIQAHKKLTIGCGIGVVVLILVMVWAFAIAPRATITVGIRTTSSNFSENITFTEKLADENAAEGKFYLEQKKLETKSEVSFEATGKRNAGEKATGSVVVYTYFRDPGTTPINEGTVFTNGGLSYTATETVTLAYDASEGAVCDNATNLVSVARSGCQVSARVSVVANEPGASYNLAATTNGWTTVANVGVYSDTAMSGGTDRTVTVVQQSDIDAAKAKLESASESANKAKLLETVEEGDFVIDSSFKQTVGDAVSSPAVGEEVKEGEKATLTVVTTDTIYVIDDTKVEEFITSKAKLADNYKIYEMNDPFIENFTKTDAGYVAKLKTSYVSGPKLTESDVVEIVKGKGIGTARQDLEKSVNGIGKIVIDVNFPWVMSIPDDNNKIAVNIDIENQ